MASYALIVAAGVLQNSGEVFGILDSDTGGAATFSTGVKLSGNGQLPVTHYGCRTPLKPETLNALQNMTTNQFKAYVDALAATYNPPRNPPGSVVAFKNNLQISAPDANFWTFAASLGLQPIAEAV